MIKRINNQNTNQVGQSSKDLKKQKIQQNAERFQQIYQQEIIEQKKINLSAHVIQRLKQRNIVLSKVDMEALKRGMQKVEEKGGKESLLLYKDLAFIASIRSRTVITAISQNEMKENVFTNIDSAVIIEE